MKKIISKRDIRSQIEQQIEDFLNQGGEVTNIEQGFSGRINPTEALKPMAFDKPKEERTFVPEVIATLEERKQKEKKTVVKKPLRRPRKKIIYDDFGEPLRWEWDE
jgi:hypothetical protein